MKDYNFLYRHDRVRIVKMWKSGQHTQAAIAGEYNISTYKVRKIIEASMTEKDHVLKRFMKEQFDFSAMVSLGIFKKEIRNDYDKQAARICQFLGLETVFEYGSKDIQCHLSFGTDRPLHIAPDGKLKEEPFITKIDNIYK